MDLSSAVFSFIISGNTFKKGQKIIVSWPEVPGADGYEARISSYKEENCKWPTQASTGLSVKEALSTTLAGYNVGKAYICVEAFSKGSVRSAFADNNGYEVTITE